MNYNINYKACETNLLFILPRKARFFAHLAKKSMAIQEMQDFGKKHQIIQENPKSWRENQDAKH